MKGIAAPYASRAEVAVLLRDAVFSPSGTIVRLRRGKQHNALVYALATCQPFALSEQAESDVAVLEGIRRGDIVVC